MNIEIIIVLATIKILFYLYMYLYCSKQTLYNYKFFSDYKNKFYYL